jgi:hypothetical protein
MVVIVYIINPRRVNIMNVKSMFGGASTGKDVSRYFKLSFKGLAARATPEGPFFAYDHDTKKLIDVTDLTFDGVENLIYRLPVQSVKRGDLIITGEAPFGALFVQDVADGKPTGLNLSSITETYTQPTNVFNIQFFVKVVSLLDGFGGETGANNLLPFLLLGNRDNGNKSDDSLTTLFMLQFLGGGNALDGSSLLPFLLLSGDKSDGLEKLLLLKGLGEGKNPLGNLFGQHSPRPATVAGDGETAYSKPSRKS